MTTKQMDKFIFHCDKYFCGSEPKVIHPILMNDLHIDILLYEPNEKFPYWKLVTMGASDYKMPPFSPSVAPQNEYVMLVDKDEDLNDKTILNIYCKKLWIVSSFAYMNKTHITYRHSFEWKNDDENDEMVGAFIELPQVFDFDFLQYKAGLFKKVGCLLVVLLNRQELDNLMQIGPFQFSDYLFPDDENAKKHFLCERKRSEKF